MMLKKLFLILAFSIINLHAGEKPIALHYFSGRRPFIVCGFLKRDLNSNNLDTQEDLGHNCFVVTIRDPREKILPREIYYGHYTPTSAILVTPDHTMIRDADEHASDEDERAKVKSIVKKWHNERLKK